MPLGTRQPDTNRCVARRYSSWLWGLTALFALRVAAQPLARIVDHPLLPRFESWHSAAVPYGLLLASQLVIVVAMVATARRFSTGRVEAQRTTGLVALWAGGVYLGAMVARLTLGLTLLSESRWFASWLPTLFHLVLAAFLLVVGAYHRRATAVTAADRNRRYASQQARD